MARGRPPSWQIFGDLDQGVWTQTVAIDARARLSLPSAVQARLAWFSDADELLAELRGDGAVYLSDWADNGPRVDAAIRERYAVLPPAERARFALAAMDSYMRVGLEGSGRVQLPMTLMTQLDPFAVGFVRVVASNGELALWNDAIWRSDRRKRLEALTTGGIG